ncbi:MAG: hypothetical protein ACREHD_24925, partial [Pirellulales bacterium]
YEQDPLAAAQLLLEVARARNSVRHLSRGHVVLGRLIIEDAKLEPELVLAQMPVLRGGYFAGDVADFDRPICFRAHGYEPVDVPLAGRKGDVVALADVRLKTLPSYKRASLHGTVELDGESPPTVAKVVLHLQVGPVNAPHGYSARPRWPDPVAVSVNEKGKFLAEGLTPGNYYVQVAADKHTEFTKGISIKPSEHLDFGSCRLFLTESGR